MAARNAVGQFATAAVADPVVAEPVKKPDYEDHLYKGKYSIHNPANVKFVPRSKFLQSLVGQIDQGDTIEETVIKSLSKDAVTMELRELAAFYVKIKNKGARLPNFARWITGMWASNKDYANFLAKEGQKAAARRIVLSTNLLDILRCADTPHFASCFRYKPGAREDGGGYDAYSFLPVKIAEECPGIGIVYVDDEHGKMMGRQWMHHARLLSTGEDVCVLTSGYYGCLQGDNLARLMAAKGIRVGYRDYGHGGEAIEYVGCFTKYIHHDLDTWSPGARIKFIKP